MIEPAPAAPVPMTRTRAFWRGTHAMFGVPALVLYAGILGYGAFAREVGLTLGQALALPIFLQALPHRSCSRTMRPAAHLLLQQPSPSVSRPCVSCR